MNLRTKNPVNIDQTDLKAMDKLLADSSSTPLKTKLYSSLTIQLLAILAGLYVAVWCLYPWRPLAELDIPAWMLKYASNTAQIVQKSNAPVIILGSSLIDAPRGRLKRENLYQEELNQGAKQTLAVDLSTVPGAMISDQSFVVQELFANGKNPKFIILTYAPREFMDNEVGDRLSSTPTRSVVSFINRRQSMLPRQLSMQAITDCLSNHTLFCDLVRRHVLKLSNTWICELSGHPLTLWDSTHGSAAERKSQPSSKPESATNSPSKPEAGLVDLNGPDSHGPIYEKRLAQDLHMYSHRYNPYNEKRCQTQMQALRELLANCRAHQSSVLLVGMPISPANKALLADGIYQKMDNQIKLLAQQYGAAVSDCNELATFDQQDFRDSVHLSKNGSLKFLPIFNSIVRPVLVKSGAP